MATTAGKKKKKVMATTARKKKKKAMAAKLLSPSSLGCNKTKKEGDDNVAAMAFCVGTKKKKNATVALMCCNKTNKINV